MHPHLTIEIAAARRADRLSDARRRNALRTARLARGTRGVRSGRSARSSP